MPSLTVIGPGTLGLNLATHAVSCGLSVRLAGRDRVHVQTALDRFVARHARSSPAKTALIDAARQIQVCHTWEESLASADWCVEALPEDLALKREAWQRLADFMGNTTPFTGSSSLSLRSIRQTCASAFRLVGFHAFLPIARMPVVEVVAESDTPEALLTRTQELATHLSLRPVRVQNQPGYAASRMAIAQALEAMRLLEQGVATAKDLDTLMMLGYGHPVGPLELSDRIGLELRLAIAEELWRATGDPVFNPPEILRNLVRRGDTGRKAGQGLYTWSDGVRVE